MTEEELARIEARAKAAGAGPWSVEYTEMGMAPDARLIAFLKDDDDRYLAVDEDPSAIDGPPSPVLEFCASAREDIPALIAALREAWQDRDAAYNERDFLETQCEQGKRWFSQNVTLENKLAKAESAIDRVKLVASEQVKGLSEALTELESERDALRAQVATLREALGWYGENARLCRLIHSGGDIGRKALDEDGGEKARGALATKPEDMP
jgi:hypothetical protein